MFGRLLLSFLFALGIGGCADSEARLTGSHPALWEIRSTEGDIAGWLFGTIHALPQDTVWRFDALDQAIDTSGMLLVEVANLNDSDAVAAIFRQKAYDRPPDAAVAQRIDPAMRADYIRFARTVGTDESELDRMESWAAALTLASLSRSGEPAAGVDRQLIADYCDRPIGELEGAERQFATFDALPEREQRDLLDAVLAEAIDKGGPQNTILAAWLKGDVGRLDVLTREGMLADPELRQILLIDRNRDWAVRIVRAMQESRKPLVAVGAGHMLGEDGLPALLAAHGYEVRRVR